jgi:uncharacterized metal-binding protein YceD (DUF177 family)
MSDPVILSHPVAVDRLRSSGVTTLVTADAETCEAIARSYGLEKVISFAAKLEARPWGRDGIAVSGVVEAEVCQVCSVSLDVFQASVRETVEVTFAPPAETRKKLVDDDEVEEDLDAPDPLVGRTVDLGAVALEFFALGLDPYPRKPGVAFEDRVEDTGAEHPFAALAKLKSNGGENPA